MASTYTTGFGIEKIGTGEQSGTWGTTTNHNADILDRIASYKAVALSGTTHTLTIREASPGSGTENLQDGMYRVIKFTGALGGNNTVTIAPNTSPAWFIIENATTDSGSSGPYTVILTQGSGANVTVQNGKNAIVYCDGAGSGAVVYDALADLQVGTLEVTGAAAIDGLLTAAASVAVTGNVTATGTVEPAGDTAASDNAAIGYTSAEGLILTGQGSTNDVTIKNDADADVITIATGGTNVDIVGDVTASTVNADGDTAASDNAAMGYTSAEGLILTGQGSTNDVTIKNDADADVITIATGATNVDVVGDLTAATLNADGDTAAGDDAAIGWTSAEGIIITGQGSTNDVTIKNDADADVITIATGATNVDVVGDLTASTLNADGDTAAGDNAAIGYTAAEGLILTGQGSTNDVTIKNDADADVLTIPTGTTAAVFAGNMRMTKGGDISSASPLVIDTDGNYFDVTGTTNFAAMTVAVGNFFMLQFDGALTITHGSGIELPGAANLTTAAGDRLICYATAADTVEVMNVATEAAASAGGGFTLATPLTPTSGTSITFSGIPSGTTMVVINLAGIAVSAATGLDIQIGDSGGIETSGYVGCALRLTTSVAGNDSDTEWFLNDASNSAGWDGNIILALTDSTNNIWTFSGFARKDGEKIAISAGSKPLSAELTQIKFKSRNGSATFTAGTANIMYQ